MKNRIRIESDESVVRNAKIFFLLPDDEQLFDGDGERIEEIDISRCIRGVDLHLHVGEPATATLHTLFVDARVSAQVGDVILRRLKPRSWWRRRHSDITSMGDRFRVFLTLRRLARG